MECLSLRRVAEAVNGNLINFTGDDINITGVSTDSRKIKEGDMFIALCGLNMDGHDYAQKAIKSGAAIAMVERGIEGNIPQIIVEDTAIALKKLAGYYRNMFDIEVIGVTGSTGKTSTKEIIACVLSQKFNVHKTMKNFNNEIGLPLTIFELEKDNEISILEMGMNNLGEIERLAEVARPSIGVITNIGTAHIENLISRDNILIAKMEMTTYFDDKSILIINSDDDYLSKTLNKKYDVKRISIKGTGDYNAYDIINHGEYGVEFKCIYRDQNCKFTINVPGIHNIYNALFAIAIGDIFDMDSKLVQAGIDSFKATSQRMNIINMDEDGGGGIKIINDCYNANPDSMKAALDVLKSYENNRRIALLGDMYELGSYSEEAHIYIGNYLKDKCDMFIGVGEDAIYMYNEAKLEANIDSHYFKNKDEASAYLKSIIRKNDVILIKASRGMKMEDITNYLLEHGKKGIR